MTATRRFVLLLVFCATLALAPLALAHGGPGDEEIQGVFRILHSDDFAAKKASFRYFLDTPQGQVSLDVGVLRNPERLAGRRVRLQGLHRNGTFVVAAGSGSAQPVGGTVAAVSGAKRVAVILFNFANNTSQPWTASSVRGIVFDNSNSVAAYYSQASNGQLALTGDVYGWYTISNSNSSCDWSNWATSARSKAQTAGVNLGNYDYLVYAFPTTSSCGWAGLGYLPGSGAWINGAMSLRVVGHELGHNLGVHHASTLSCTSGTTAVTLSSTCSASEYGDPYSIMGSSSTDLPHNWHRIQFGWLSDTQTITASGTYTLRPSEGTVSPRALRIARGDGTYFWLELRQPGGVFDTFAASDPAVNGVTIRLNPDSTSIVQSKLLDMNPQTSTFGDSPLAVGESFTDPTSGVSITTSAVSSTGATVVVSMGGGGGGDTQAPTAPGNLAAQAQSSSSVRLTWTASTDNVGVTGYEVSRGGVVLGTTNSLTYTNSGLSPSTTYGYSVVALDAAGHRSPAAAASATTPAAPDTLAPTTPGGLAGQALSTSSVRLTWTASTDDVGVTGYRVSRGGVVLGTVTALAYTDSGLAANTIYPYSVVALDAAGHQSQAATSSVRTLADTAPPGAPSNLTGKSQWGQRAVLSWGAATDNVGVVTYRVFRGGVQVAQAAGTSYTDKPGRGTFTYTVVAVDAAGNVGPSSNVVSVTVTF